MTRNSFHYQIKRCTEIANEWRDKDLDINLVNATEGGAFIEGFKHMSLDAFATSRNLSRTTGEKQIYLEGKANISKTTINAYLLKISNLLDRMNAVAEQVIKLDKKQGKNRGLQKRIQKTIQKFQTLNDETSLVQIAMQDSIAQVIGTSEKAQKIVTHADFFKKVKRCAAQLKHATKVH
jgi:hypothetical protein